jgi:ABC-type antimicrobial peptide transport system permease subunit
VYITFSDKHDIVSQAEQIAAAFGIDKADYLVSDAALERYYKENSKEPTSYALFSLILIVLGALTAVAIIFIVRNSFNISVHERNRDYGILRCIGLTRRQIIHMILYEALSVGIMGTALGILVGYGFCRLAFYNIGKYFEYLGGYGVTPVSVLWTVICMLVATGYAMVGPIQKLYSLNPIEALRRVDEVNSVRKERGKKEKSRDKSNKKDLKQYQKMDRLTKRFGIEAGYAYRNLMRTRSRFLLVAVTLTIGGSFYIGGSTFSKLLSEEMNSFASDDYTGFFNCQDETEFNTVKRDLSSLNCVSNGNGKVETTFDWTTQDDAAEVGNASLYETGSNAAYFIGLEESDYEKILSGCEKLGLKINAKSNALNVVEIENSVENDFVIPFKLDYKFNVQAVLDKEEFKNLAADVDYYFWAEDYMYGQPIYVYSLDGGFEALFEAGLSDDLYISNVQGDYTYNISVDERASDYYKFENYINNTVHDYVDVTLELKFILKVFKLVRLAINTVVILVLLIFFINSINIQHSQMLLRKDEFGILRVIGMSKKQLKKSLIIENMAGVVAAAFWSVVLGVFGGNVLARVLEWVDQIDDEVRDYSPVTIDIKSVVVVVLLLLFLGLVSAAIASNTDENSKH